MKPQRYDLLSYWLVIFVIVIAGCVPVIRPEPTSPNVLRIAVIDMPEPLDPALVLPWNQASSTVLQAMYQTLVTYAPDEFATITPGLAESWEFSEDFRVLVFHLRQDTRFANGDPVTAGDVVFSVERLKNLGGPPAFLAETIAFIEAIDDYTMRFVLERPDPAILDKLATEPFSIVSRVQVEGQEDEFFIHFSAGSGPYVLTEWLPGEERLVLEPNPYYPFDESFIKFDQIIIWHIPDAEQQIMLLQAGELDIALDLTAEQAEVFKDETQFLFYEDASADLVFLAANLQSDTPIRDPLVQAAMRYALDYNNIRERVVGGAETPASFIPVGYPEALAEGIEFYPEKARTLLEEAGYQQQPIRLAYYPSAYMQTLAEMVSANLQAVGFNIELVLTEAPYTELTQQMANLDLALLTKRPNYLDAQDYLDFLPGGELAAAIGWQSEELAQLRDTALQAVDPNLRKELLLNAQLRINEIGPYAFVLQLGRVNVTPSNLVYSRDARGSMKLLTAKPIDCPRCCENPGECCKKCKYKCPGKCK